MPLSQIVALHEILNCQGHDHAGIQSAYLTEVGAQRFCTYHRNTLLSATARIRGIWFDAASSCGGFDLWQLQRLRPGQRFWIGHWLSIQLKMGDRVC